MPRRDDFLKPVKDVLARRAGQKCSNPGCKAPTSGPALEVNRSVNVGVAAHISGAAPGGPRFDPAMSSHERGSIENGIWLCKVCADVIDKDEVRYTTTLLRAWKEGAEEAALRELGSRQAANQQHPLKFKSMNDQGFVALERYFTGIGYKTGVVLVNQLDSKVYEGWEVGLDPSSGRQVWLVFQGGSIVEESVLIVRPRANEEEGKTANPAARADG